jgi:hypothetical protein
MPFAPTPPMIVQNQTMGRSTATKRHWPMEHWGVRTSDPHRKSVAYALHMLAASYKPVSVLMLLILRPLSFA